MKRIKFDIKEFVKTAIIFALTFSMLSIAGIYMSARQNAGQPLEVPLEKRRVFENGGIIPSAIQINPNHINPLQIIITSDSKSITAVYDSKLVSDIYRDCRDVILALFDGSAECIIIDDNYEAEELWKRCIDSPDSVYIRYAGDYVYPVINDFFEQAGRADIYEAVENKTIAKVHGLFIIPTGGTDTKFYGITRDTAGNAAVFYPSSGYREYLNPETGEKEIYDIYINFVDSVNFAAYNDIAGTIPCRFLKNNAIGKERGFNKNNIKNLELPGDFILFDDFTYSSVLSYINPIFDEYNEIDTRKGEKLRELLKVFNFNIESSGLHSVEENGKSGKKFIENHGSLTVFENGRIFYYHTSADISGGNIADRNVSGIHLSNFLGFDSGYYTFHEKIKAASIFINSLNSDIAGNESDLYLSDIKYEQDRLTIVFSYYYRGIKIQADNQDLGVYIVISRNSITEAGLDTLNITAERMSRNVKQVIALNYFDDKLQKTEYQASDETDPEEDYSIFDIDLKEDYIMPGLISAEVNFNIKSLELIYNINTTAGINNYISAAWVIH